MFKRLFIFSAVLWPCVLLAQTIVGGVEAADQAFLDTLHQTLKSSGGASALGLIVILTQLALKFMDTSYFNRFVPIQGTEWKLPAVSILSLISGVAVLMHSEGMTLGMALIHSTTLSAGMVFAHQWYKWVKPSPKIDATKIS